MKSMISIETKNWGFQYRDLKHFLFIVMAICLSFPLSAQYDRFSQINIDTEDRDWNSISTAYLDDDNSLDILALGYKSGEIRVHWFKMDEEGNFTGTTIKQIGGGAKTPGHVIGSDLDHDDDNDVILL